MSRKPESLCVECAERKPLAGRVRCAPCLKRQAEWQLARRLKNRSEGGCMICGRKVRVPIKCDRCEEDNRARRAETRVRAQRDPRAVAELGVGRDKQLSAVLAAVLLLRRGRWSAPELAAELDLPIYSARRILRAIPRVGLTVTVSPDRHQVYYAIPSEALRRRLGF